MTSSRETFTEEINVRRPPVGSLATDMRWRDKGKLAVRAGIHHLSCSELKVVQEDSSDHE